MDSPAPPPPSPPPWAVPWEGAGPVPLLPALAAPLVARREAQRLLLELRRARPLPGLNHLKRLRGGAPGRAPAVLLCLEADVPPPEEWEEPEGDGAINDITNDITNDTSDVTNGIDATNDITDTPGAATDVTGTMSDVTSAANDTSMVGKGTRDVTDDVANITGATTAASVVAKGTSDVTDDVTDAASLPPLPPLRVLLGPSVSPRGLGPPFRVLVPGRAPHPGPETSAALAGGELWPWVLRGEPPPSTQHPPPWHPSDLPAVTGAMAAAVAAALSGARAGMVPAGGAVLDPGTGRVVVAAGDGRRGGHPLGHATMRCLEAVARCRRGNGGNGEVSGAGGYLCQGWDVILTREPCALCAMALVLARARRVLFGAPAPQGALSTRYGLHGRARLNHHYRAYGGVAPGLWAPLLEGSMRSGTDQ